MSQITAANLFLIMLLPALSASGAAQNKSIATQKTAPIMDGILNSLSEVVPYSIRGEEFTKKENQKKIVRELEKLSAQSKGLASHFSPRASDYSYLATSLARDAKEASLLYKQGQYSQARFILHNISSACISCHTKIPSNKKSPGATELFAKIKKSGLSNLELARFKTMSREFDEAIALYEKEFISDPNLLDSGSFTEYLKLTLRVKLDIDQVLNLLTKVVSSGNLRRSQEKLFGEWIETARSIKNSGLLKQVSVASVKKLLSLGIDEGEYGYGGEGLLYDICASSVANRLLDNVSLKKDERSELYYYAGRAEVYISDSFWFSELENYLEQSIRLAPKQRWAKDAFRLLEEEYTLGYTGSSGTNLPDDIALKLRELKSLVY